MKAVFVFCCRLFFVGGFNIILTVLIYGQQLAFPGAEGFGKYTTGGRGGVVIEVTNLNDNGPGSLREAISQEGARTVVFRVSGTIFLESDLSISKGNLTIAGQTAPGDGITLANYNFRISTDNVIIRYIRSRLGDLESQEEDAFTCTGRSNIIVDHCSFSWSIDEAASCYNNRNFTMQWCIISESLYNSVHSKGPHGYGGIWGGNRATYHHNLIAHHSSRTPRFNGARGRFDPWEELVDHRNNVIYNWGFNSCYGGEPSEIDGTKAYINMVGNYYKAGPGTSSGEITYRIVSPDDQSGYGYSYWYVDSNFVEGYPPVTEDNWLLGVQNVSESEKQEIKLLLPSDFDITTKHTAEEAYALVLENAGATLPRRDTIDRRIVKEVINGTATYGGIWGSNSGIIDSQEDVGGWPVLFTGPAPPDNDHDGMADDWETVNGLNPGNPADRNGDTNSNGYTNLEDYLASIVTYRDFIYPPTDFGAELIDINDIMLTWTDNSGIEQGYYIERKEGGSFEVVDTVPANTITYTDSGLNDLTEYFYRVRAFSLSDTSIYSDVISETTLSELSLPLQATNPVPADNLEYVRTSSSLGWKEGVGADSHQLYLGLNNPPDFTATLTGNNFKPDTLLPGQTYYWRVDEVNINGTTEGEVWSFATRPDLPGQLVGHWEFETSSSAIDSSEFSNHGEYYNFTAASFLWTGAINKALSFNGLDQYVRVPHSYEFDFESGDFSVAFWLRQYSYQVDTTKIYSYLMKGSLYENPELSRSGKRYEIYYNPLIYKLRFEIDDNITMSRVEAEGEEFFIKGDWVHLVAARDTKSGTINLYADGILVSSAEDNTTDISQDEDLYFGYNIDNDMYLKGVLDDVRLYNYALSDNEIDSLYKLGIPTKDIPFYNDNKNLSIYPNPAGSILYLKYKLKDDNDFIVNIYSLSGQVIRSIQNNNRSASGVMEIVVNDLVPGIYFIQFINNTNIITEKICINH
jgi:pectate lyase